MTDETNKMPAKRRDYLVENFGVPGRWPSREDIEDAGVLLRKHAKALKDLIAYTDRMLIEHRDLTYTVRELPETVDGMAITPERTLYRVEDDGSITIFSATMTNDNGDDCWERCYGDEDAAEEAAAGNGGGA